MTDWRDNPKPTSVSRPVDVRSGTGLATMRLFAELDRLQGSLDYAKGRADALAELAQSDEWKAHASWMDALYRSQVVTNRNWSIWEALRAKVEGT